MAGFRDAARRDVDTELLCKGDRTPRSAETYCQQPHPVVVVCEDHQKDVKLSNAAYSNSTPVASAGGR